MWSINFFFFVLVLIFIWSKMYLISRKINEVLSILKKGDELPEIISKENE
ncbi:MAG TPA: hypothetical protein VF335_04300 [Chitinivibrionales bacterium]